MTPPRAIALVAMTLAMAVGLAASAQLAAAGPVADSDALYTLCGRVFADPHAYGPAPMARPGESPYAKGNAPCRASTFISYDEAISGLTYLESRYPDFVELYRLDEDFADVLDEQAGDGYSAGISTSTGQRERVPLYLVRVTDENSDVPEADKAHFAIAMGIHGIERAGVEGGLRAVEDLATWAATSPDQPIMETLPESVPVGEVLRTSSVYFVLANPDGWRRGDLTRAGPFFSRYNGNGVDLNRDWPAQGYTFRPYTPWSEPESRSFGKVLKSIKERWQGGLDLHGQLTADSFSFTLLRSSQRPFDENVRMLQYVTGAWRDAEARLSWSALIKPNSESADDPRLYGVKWGTTWDTIGYTNTGSISNWFDDTLGLGADAISNEMTLSHLSNCGTGNCYIPEVEQLHVDGNKSLIYGLINYTLLPDDTTFRFEGRAAYVDHGLRLTGAADPLGSPPSGAPPQEGSTFSLIHQGSGATIHEFEILGPADGVDNGGVSIRVTFVNAQGVGVGDQMNVYLDRYAADDEHAETDPEGWETVQEDYTGGGYFASGTQVDVVGPLPGRYRVRVTGSVATPFNGTITFTNESSWADPGQRAYDASNLDFFTELREHLPDPDQLVPITPAEIAGTAELLRFDTVIASDRAFSSSSATQQAAIGERLREFVEAGGNLVLTDDALQLLETVGLVEPGAVTGEIVYAGHVGFTDQSGATTYEDPLSAGVAQPGAAEGSNHRHQITDPGPIGFAILGENGADSSNQPQWAVDPAAWDAIGGRTVGLLQGGLVTFGEVPVGEGQVRILGSLIPFPSDEFHIPHGVADYAVTYAGYEVTRNLLSHTNPARVDGPGPAPAPSPEPEPAPSAPPVPSVPLPSTGGGAALVGAALALALSRAASRRR